MSDYLLLTGSTGLLGRYLIRDLLLAGRRVAVLARPSRKETAGQRIEAIMQMWESELGRTLPRPICLEGDICSEQLGLNRASRDWVAEYCSTMLHSAASLTFHSDGTGEPYRSNVEGTRNMLELCRITGIRDLHYVSTAYVCGLRQEPAREDELDVGQEFRNDYERTKLAAEELVRSASFLDQLTVYRPAVISGDSKTGYTNTYHGLYLYLRLMSLLVPQQELDELGRRSTPLRLPMKGDERRNVVPVDWVSGVITHLLQTPAAHGRTFNLAPEKCLTPREIIDAGYSYFNSTGIEYVGDEPIDPATYNRFEAELLPSIGMYDNYESTDPTFDCTNLSRFASHLPCPVIDEETIHQYIRFGEENRWGKRRRRPAFVEVDAARVLDEFVEPNRFPGWRVNGRVPERIGIDIVGPGGGQWTLLQGGSQIVGVGRGLSSNCEKVFQLSAVEFAKIVETAADESWKHLPSVWTDEPHISLRGWFDCEAAVNAPADVQAANAE